MTYFTFLSEDPDPNALPADPLETPDDELGDDEEKGVEDGIAPSDDEDVLG